MDNLTDTNLGRKYILEFIFHPKNFPDISSYYLMELADIEKFEYDYRELSHNSIKNFLYSEDLTDLNTSYHIYGNTQSDFFKKMYDYLMISQKGGFCDLLNRFYSLQNQNTDIKDLFLSDKNFDSESDNQNDIIRKDNKSESSDSIYKKTEDIVNIITLFNKNNLDENTQNEIKNIILNNPKIIEDTEVCEINKHINDLIINDLIINK
jgi:hypothetical protein